MFATYLLDGEPSSSFKARVEGITGVPSSRQKLIAKSKGCWKGPLKDDVAMNLSSVLPSLKDNSLVVTLIGSAETLAAATQKTTFLEDLSPQELQAQEEAEAQAAMETAEGMIPALQFPPHQRDDQKQEMYQYNRLVTGLPQKQIEQELKYGQGAEHGKLQGKVAMNLGLELRRAYVNDIAYLYDGTCVSVMDDGHVQLWKHATQQQDTVHARGAEGGVDSVVALRRPRIESNLAFATAGRGSLYLWSLDGDVVMSFQAGPQGTYPASLVSMFGGLDIEHPTLTDEVVICLAARFQVTWAPNPSQFRLPPQNEDERRRRAQAAAQEQVMQRNLIKASRTIQIWYMIQGASNALQSKMVELPANDLQSSTAITCLQVLSYPDGTRCLVAGDTEGSLWIWKVQLLRDGRDIDIELVGRHTIIPVDASSCTIVCLEALKNGRLAVSTDNASQSPNGTPQQSERSSINVEVARGVHIFDISQATAPILLVSLSGHANDAVICMCQLPTGDFLTGGGKLDATLQLWSKEQLEANMDGPKIATKAQKTLTEVGYVFALVVLPDAKDDSNYYAVAAARYNTVKLVI